MITEKLNWYGQALTNLGVTALLRRQLSTKFARSAPFRLSSKFADYDLLCRPGTSDLAVFDQIFVEREYGCLDDLELSGTILDCGANVGYSSAYFLTRFPGCNVLAVEPHPENFSILCENLMPYSGRQKCLNAAVWSHPTHLKLDMESSGLGREWGRKYVQSNGDTIATDMPSLRKVAGAERISLLKMDIEGAEEQVFSAKDVSWLSVVDNIVIELHGTSRRAVFLTAIKDQGFGISQSGELTICRRSAPK